MKVKHFIILDSCGVPWLSGLFFYVYWNLTEFVVIYWYYVL